MTRRQLLTFTDVAQLRAHEAAWNDLWLRSDTTSPSARAEQVALWIDQFAPGAAFRAFVVADGDRFVAALPLVAKRVKHLIRVGALPTNEWTSGGDLLVDPAADVPGSLDQLCEGLVDVPWPLLWFDEVAHQSARWQALLAAFARTGMTSNVKPHHDVGEVNITGDWVAYEASLSGDHRRSRRRCAKRLAELGTLRLDLRHSGSPEEVDALVSEGFAVEDRSWKGAEGSSVIKCGMLGFFQEQARRLADSGNLELVFFRLDERPLAFAYCWRAKGTRFVAKLGYDDEFRQHGPGQHLVHQYLQVLHAQAKDDAADHLVLDFWGRLMPWSESWSNRTYEVARIVAAPPRLISRSALWAYEALRKSKAPAVLPPS